MDANSASSIPPPHAPSPSVKAGGTSPQSTGTPEEVEKVLVAVHGIGDQPNYGTIQTVVNQFCTFFGQPAGIPLGSFDTGEAAHSIGEPHDAEVFKRYAFAEVYWAAVPRDLVKAEHRLEESKAWASTIVERLRLRYEIERKEVKEACEAEGRRYVAPKPPDFPLIKRVLGEIIQTIAVVDRLCFLADKAGVFKFDLRKLLDDYLGDVQVVAEFQQERVKILRAFSDTMEKICSAHPTAKIYIVAHSEGTVVAFLGLLEGFRKEPRPGWSANVRGLMTIGSPMDKHLVLWPELFGSARPSSVPTTLEVPAIEWRNYYDYGDPVGFELDGTRQWIKDKKWRGVFHFSSKKGEHDYGFTRYPFPGKAHVDYWNDDHVFGHFLENVVDKETTTGKSARAPRFPDPPRTRAWAWLVSSIVPYAGIAVILFVAAYVLLKAVLAASDPANSGDLPGKIIAIRAGGIAALLYGMTAISRVSRLTRRWDWRIGSVAFAVACVFAFGESVEKTQLAITHGDAAADAATLWIAIVATFLIWAVSVVRPSWGVRPLLLIGAGAAVLRVGIVMINAKNSGTTGPIWPVFMAAAAFIYLWWLGALLFDLVVAWHLYIRDFNLRRHVDKITGRGIRDAA